MIRLAFLGVFLLGGLIAFGAFFLARGSDSGVRPTAPDVATAPAENSPAPPPTERAPDAEPIYFLKDIDLSQGSISVVLSDALTGRGDLVVRDPARLAAAQDTAYINSRASGGDSVGMVALAVMGADPKDTVARIYQGDAMIGAVDCLSTSCGRLSADVDMDLGGLLDAAEPLIAARATFDTYDAYLDSIAAINATSDFMFFDLAPPDGVPAPRQTAAMELYLPTLIIPAGDLVDPNVTSALARSLVNPLLPDGASIDGVTFSDTGTGVIADQDSGTPVLAGGAPIAFDGVTFTNLRVSVTGAADLDQAALDSLSEAPLARTDYAAEFTAFLADRLQNPCTDCFSLQMRGDFYEAATITLSQPEGYALDYYDLREAP